MRKSPAVESFRYALGIELLKLYTVVFIGILIIDFSQNSSFLRGFISPFDLIFSTPFFLFGIILFIGGLVGVIHRVLSDIN